MGDFICPARLTVMDDELRHWGATWVMGSGEVCCVVRWDAVPRCGPVGSKTYVFLPLVCPQSHSEFSCGGHFVLPVWFRGQRSVRFPGTGIKDGCECQCWAYKLNPGPLVE